MAIVPFPSVDLVRVHEQNMYLQFRQYDLEARATADVTVVEYGLARWVGEMVLYPSESAVLARNDLVAGAIDAFFASLGGEANETYMRLERPTVSTSARTVDNPLTNSSGLLEHTIEAIAPSDAAAIAEDFVVGRWVRLEAMDRIFIIVAVSVNALDPSRLNVVFQPAIKIAALTPILSSSVMRIRQGGQSRSSSWNSDFRGPWTLNWVEAPVR